MLVLGVSDLKHDTAAALLDREGPVAALEEDKLTRSATTCGIPSAAIDRCLHEAGAEHSDLSVAALASRPRQARIRGEALRHREIAPRSAVTYQPAYADGRLDELSEQLLRQSLNRRTRFVCFDHHLCHAASAFYPSDFDRALIVTLDEAGDMCSGMIALGEGTELRVLSRLRFPHSLGWFYTQVTGLLGFRPHRDEHKVQWLSKHGAPDFITVFRKLFSKDSEGLPIVNLHYLRNRLGDGPGFSPEIGRDLQVAASSPPRESALGASIARSAQDFLEETVVELTETYRRKTRSKYLCLAGGVFLNVLLVRALEKRAGFQKVFVQPVSGNPGSALGAAYLAQERLSEAPDRERLSHLYLGPQFDSQEIKIVLDNCKMNYRYLPIDNQLIEETTRLLQEHKIVAWYQGRMEFGHRALGNRSILASPFSPYVMENLNVYVKHREDFHPFALAVPYEKSSELFECGDNCRFMASTGTLKSTLAELQRFAFNGRTVRVHTVEKHVNPRFWALLQKFGETAPAAALVNTSFNLFGEPLVCDPREAVRSFCCSGIDALAMGNFLIVKR
jgi:carbamoyltransferase